MREKYTLMKNILIFGATGAIGEAIARELKKDDASVFLAGRNEAALQSLSHEIDAPFAVFDAMDEASVRQVIATASAQTPLTGLIWAVGSILLKPLGKLTSDDFQNCFYLNVTSAALAIKEASASLREGQGSVLLFSSVAATQGFNAHGAISAAKAAVEGMATAIATELAPDVRVNVMAPSLTDSKMAAPLLSNEMMAKGIAQAHPMRRVGQGGDFAPLASLLMNPERSAWITGAIIAVDGGRKSLRTKG